MSLLAYREAETIRRKGWYNKVDLYICPSEFLKNMLKKAGFTSSPVVTMRNPLPLGTTYEYGSSDSGYILYFGRLIWEKGVSMLIEAAKITGYPLVICGTGPDEDKLIKLAERAENISFKGFQSGDALWDLVRHAKCVALPSQVYENGPYSAMEAMALGKPLVVSDRGGLPELVVPGKNGFIFQASGGAAALAETLEQVFSLNSETYGAMCRTSMDMAKNMFDPVAYVERLMGYYAAFKAGSLKKV